MSQENDRQLPDGWQWVKLGDVADLKNGINFTSNQKGSGILTVDVLNMYPNGIYLEVNDLYRVDIKSNNEYMLQTNDILFVRSSVKEEGVAWTTLFSGHTEPVTFCGFIIRARFLNPEISPEYFVYYCRSEAIRNFLVNKSTRGTITNINQESLKTLKIPLPPLSEQKRIAAILNEQMEAVEKARKATEAQLEAAKALPAAYLRAVFESEEANSWERRKLGDIARLISGGTPSRNNSSSFKGTIAWVKTLDLNCEVVKETEEYISETAFDEIRGEMLPVGSVMIAMYGGGGTIGKSGILGLPAVTNQAICSILPNYNVFIPEFLHAWVLNFRPKWMDYSSGNRRDPNIKKGVISNIECPFPTVEKQKQIASTLTEQMQEVERLKQNLKEQLDTINKLPAVLLRRAFKGEL
ncbi:restriction endonuclease subunit S [Microcystis panniformis]|uniref:Type I restriction-modification system specificity subunit S n=2 Tax=Microcystis TaxID=1125 RepID=A0A0K1S4T5_9CHRO|nr:restriction endonuclease subunit S [Microcystis panniformis]AKV69134.1 Type I restriction-modification system specificity subunit S [Microcystis panniformis FACHB-1757]